MARLLFPLCVLIFLGCEQESMLDDSIFVPDPELPELPAYTEWGYNTFGAQYEMGVFTSGSNALPLKLSTSGEQLEIFLLGEVKLPELYTNMSLRMLLDVEDIYTYQDLLVFHDSIIDLGPRVLELREVYGSEIREVDFLSGEIHVKRTQTVFVDDRETGLILSGTFQLRYLRDNYPVILHNGRFDFGINENTLF